MLENEHSLFGLVFSCDILRPTLLHIVFIFSNVQICWRNILTLVCFSGDVSLPNARFFSAHCVCAKSNHYPFQCLDPGFQLVMLLCYLLLSYRRLSSAYVP